MVNMGIDLGIGFEYDGFVVTSIDYKKAPIDGRPDRVTFTGNIPGNEATWLYGDKLKEHNREHEDAATFLWKCKYIEGADEKGKRVFEADRLTIKDAQKEFVKKYGENCKALFSIHGYNSEPGVILKKCKEAQGKFDGGTIEDKNKRTAIIPVIWPNINGIGLRYHADKIHNVPEAEKEFNMLLENVSAMNVFKSKNLICHSMGNQIVRRVANENVKFDNIFMVAADVRHNIFHTDYINNAGSEDSEENDGLRIFRMLAKHNDGPNKGKPKGKIYCLYNPYDFALALSPWVGGNWVNRLGQVGIGSYDSWWPGWSFDEKRLIHPEIYGYTENFNAYDRLPWINYKSHGYHWDEFAIAFYNSKIEGENVSRARSTAPDCLQGSLIEAISMLFKSEPTEKGK